MRFTKTDSTDFACYGVDLNRNFDFKWMGNKLVSNTCKTFDLNLEHTPLVSGASANPCSEIHAGPYPASEPEVKSVMDYVMSYSPRWLSYISPHTYGAIWLSPYSYSKSHIQDNFQETVLKIFE